LELNQEIKSVVLAKLDGQVDSTLPDAVITRVLNGMKEGASYWNVPNRVNAPG
jgi:hypothetical protein